MSLALKGPKASTSLVKEGLGDSEIRFSFNKVPFQGHVPVDEG